MPTFAQKRRNFEDAQAAFKSNPNNSALRTEYEAARQALIESPEVEAARRASKGNRARLSPWK